MTLYRRAVREPILNSLYNEPKVFIDFSSGNSAVFLQRMIQVIKGKIIMTITTIIENTDDI
jgi:hypothetical protein